MTEEQERMLKEVHAMLPKIEMTYDFLYKPPLEGRPTRAMQVDDLLAAVRSTRGVARIIIWIAALVVAISTIWTAGNWSK